MTAPNDLPSILPGIDSFVSAASVDVTSAQEVFARNFLEGIFRPWFQSFQGKEQPPSTTPTSETQHSRWYSHGMVQEEESSIECPTEESPETMAEPEPAQVAVGGPITIPLEPPKEESLLEIEKTISESRSGEMWKLATKPTLPENDCPTIQEKEESTMIMSSNKSRSVWESRVKLLPLSNPFDKAFDTLNPCPPCTMNYSRPNRWKPWLSWSSLPANGIGVLFFGGRASDSSLARQRTYRFFDSFHCGISGYDIDTLVYEILLGSASLAKLSQSCLFWRFILPKETLFELLETTWIAILASFRMILSRNKHKDRTEVLQHNFEEFQQRTVFLLRNMDALEENEIHDLEQDALRHSTRTLPGGRASWLGPDSQHYKRKLKIAGDHFFEHFLDGSAGVMYTSFLGLIISELLRYGEANSY